MAAAAALGAAAGDRPRPASAGCRGGRESESAGARLEEEEEAMLPPSRRM